MNCTICHSPDVKDLTVLLDGVKVMHCKNCKNAFTFPKPVPPDYALEDFQARDGATDKLTLVEQLPNEIRTSYDQQLAIINRNLAKGSSVLEIGGGEGIFLSMLKNNGYSVELVEPSITAAQRANERGLVVHNDYFQNIKFNKKFSLICMSHVLEHIDNPIEAIHEIKKLLNPDGFILLAQTNFRGFMPYFLKSNWYAWVPSQHYSHFSIQGLKFLAKESSMEISEYGYSRLYHGPSIYHSVLKYIPFLQDQIHVLLKLTSSKPVGLGNK